MGKASSLALGLIVLTGCSHSSSRWTGDYVADLDLVAPEAHRYLKGMENSTVVSLDGRGGVKFMGYDAKIEGESSESIQIELTGPIAATMTLAHLARSDSGRSIVDLQKQGSHTLILKKASGQTFLLLKPRQPSMAR